MLTRMVTMKALLILLLVFTSTTSEQKLGSDFQYTNGVWGGWWKNSTSYFSNFHYTNSVVD